ncbi:serine/threonine-protein kinase TBK1-like [Lingula anatina]|uniref:Serine/threonine-protein kinase TBK1-like n=1 Tax=Lingula anatina TaxID=7574 RepID=A0A2R2MQY9_LINAN|nr:serine/threonine-protein kinase TBK1-like [Lingula anatina]|eukprot:XP_023932417.1 serine/threonine-protein kinase TBK1-like [Lingula anatina]
MSQLSSNLRGSASYVWSTNDPLGQGATGAVYRCRHKRTGEVFAVKTFNTVSHYRPLDVQTREFDVVRKLNHRNIVSMVAIEEEQHTRNRIIVMELCDCSLYNMLEKPENAFGLEEVEFLEVLNDVAEGMRYLRDQNIVHRDIKPGNIMRSIGEDKQSIYKLTDFGAARELEESEQFVSLYGTEEYLYPDMYERAVLRRPVQQLFGKEVDLWSLGVTLYHTATGHLPFQPFGGRRNKEVMHKITADKDSGVISGIQSTENGPIEYSTELPNTCQLSKGLKLLVTPLLAGLMENTSSRMWTFDQFFATVKDIMKKVVVYVFSTATCECLSIYINKTETYAKFQDAIAEQTDIRASAQFLLFQNHHFTKIVQSMTLVERYPKTSPQDPVFLYFTDVDSALFTRLPELQIPKYPKFGTSISLENDYPLAKKCAGNTEYIVRKLRLINLQQVLLDKAMTMYIQIIKFEISGYQESNVFIVTMITETHKRLQTATRSLNRIVRVVQGLASLCGEQAPNEVRFLEEDLQVAENQLTVPCQEAVKSTEELKSYVHQFCQGVVIDDELSKRWKSNWGCLETERCVEKGLVLSEQINKTMEEFKRDKQLKRLPYNDEQIHKFEKNKMNENCTKATSLAMDHCYPNLRKVFKKFEEAFLFVCTFITKLGKIKKRIDNLTEKQSRLSTILDEKMEHCLRKFETVSDLLSSGGKRQETSPLVGSAVAKQQGTGSRPSSGKAKERENQLLREIQEELKALNLDSAEIRQAFQENTNLVKELEKLQFQNHVEVQSG